MVASSLMSLEASCSANCGVLPALSARAKGWLVPEVRGKGWLVPEVRGKGWLVPSLLPKPLRGPSALLPPPLQGPPELVPGALVPGTPKPLPCPPELLPGVPWPCRLMLWFGEPARSPETPKQLK